ncbi:MAG: hypothetical protein WAV90_09850 [Gordonia amarae]
MVSFSQIHRSGRHLAVAAVFAGAMIVAGCSGSGDDQPGTTSRSGAAAPLGTAAPPGSGSRDLSGGGTCSAGEDIVIATVGASPIISGDCGTISVSADKVRGNIESAAEVTISGSDVTLLGETWGTVTIEGAGSGTNVDRIDRLTLTAANTRVTGTHIGTATVDGDGGTINTDGIGTLTLNGDRSTIIVAGAIDGLEVHGSNNTVNWSEGVRRPATDTGKSNTYVR